MSRCHFPRCAGPTFANAITKRQLHQEWSMSVDDAITALEADGTLADIEQQWLSDVVDVPTLR